MSKQRTFVPHNQNQSKMERQIGDVEHKTTHVLNKSGAPVLFWCYALVFEIDCLNHFSKKRLGWRTSIEVLNGDTANISPFRFTFWKPIQFMQPPSFPESQWMLGQFLGIARDSGDFFTFKVWSEPEKGREYIRNVVQLRNIVECQSLQRLIKI